MGTILSCIIHSAHLVVGLEAPDEILHVGDLVVEAARGLVHGVPVGKGGRIAAKKKSITSVHYMII